MTHLTKSEDRIKRTKKKTKQQQQNHQPKSNIFTFFCFFFFFFLKTIQLKLFPEIGPIQIVEIYCATQKTIPMKWVVSFFRALFSISSPSLFCLDHWISIRIAASSSPPYRRYWLIRNLFPFNFTTAIDVYIPCSRWAYRRRSIWNAETEFDSRSQKERCGKRERNKKSYKRYIVSKAPSKSNKSSC